MPAAFALAVILPLTGNKGRRRTLAATMIFLLGYLGPTIYFLIDTLVLWQSLVS